jgi:ubiquinone/menaquinone biosynthesis C-methylase UbiE
MTDDMLALARQRRQGRGHERGVLQGQIEDLPLPDASVDVVISNCAIQPVGR